MAMLTVRTVNCIEPTKQIVFATKLPGAAIITIPRALYTCTFSVADKKKYH